MEISMGRLRYAGEEVVIVDTPGMYSLHPTTEDERVARRVLMEMRPEVVVHVVDAKNIERMLGLTLMLIEAGMNVILVLNALDEAREMGMDIDFEELERRLGIPVIPTIATTGEGVDKLREEIVRLSANVQPRIGRRIFTFHERLERYVREAEGILEGEYPLSSRVIAILALLGDEEILDMIRKPGHNGMNAAERIKKLGEENPELAYVLEMEINKAAKEIADSVIEYSGRGAGRLADKLSDAMVRPLTGSLILLLSLALLYLFVGVLGAQIIVDFLEVKIFEGLIDPAINSFLENYSPHPWISDLIGGEYGIVTLGLKYAFSIILPLVSLFFIAFSIIEDTGYLPRLALLMDRLLKKVGLSGRAVIPLVLGLGCDTMAVIVTRTLETKKEKILATLMLALGVPCSAQLGVVMGLLPDPASVTIWATIVVLVMLAVAYLASKLVPGEPPLFIIELPPLRLPKVSNILMKTWTRVRWYITEVVPLFVLASVFIWVGRITGIFDLLISVLSVPTLLIGLPRRAAVAFLYGFFRRDYGAAGFFELGMSGFLNRRQVVVAMVTITLFVPCIAQLMVMWRERGFRTALAIVLFIIPTAFSVGYIVNVLLSLSGF